MPVTSPRIKVDAVVARGAQVVLHGDSYSEAQAQRAHFSGDVASRSCIRTTIPT
jgi:threonine dehydratase